MKHLHDHDIVHRDLKYVAPPLYYSPSRSSARVLGLSSGFFVNRLELFRSKGPHQISLSSTLACASPEFSRWKHVSCASYASQCQMPRFHSGTATTTSPSPSSSMTYSDALNKVKGCCRRKDAGRGCTPCPDDDVVPVAPNGGARGGARYSRVSRLRG